MLISLLEGTAYMRSESGRHLKRVKLGDRP